MQVMPVSLNRFTATYRGALFCAFISYNKLTE